MQCNFIKQESGSYKCDKCGFVAPRSGHRMCQPRRQIFPDIDIDKIQRNAKASGGCNSCGNSESRRKGLEK
jgi:hypothetical protein